MLDDSPGGQSAGKAPSTRCSASTPPVEAPIRITAGSAIALRPTRRRGGSAARHRRADRSSRRSGAATGRRCAAPATRPAADDTAAASPAPLQRCLVRRRRLQRQRMDAEQPQHLGEHRVFGQRAQRRAGQHQHRALRPRRGYRPPSASRRRRPDRPRARRAAVAPAAGGGPGRASARTIRKSVRLRSDGCGSARSASSAGAAEGRRPAAHQKSSQPASRAGARRRGSRDGAGAGAGGPGRWSAAGCGRRPAACGPAAPRAAPRPAPTRDLPEPTTSAPDRCGCGRSDHFGQRLGLLPQRMAGGGRLLDHGGVLLRHLVELVDPGVDLAQPGRLLDRRGGDCRDQRRRYWPPGDDLLQRLAGLADQADAAARHDPTRPRSAS